MGFFDLFAPKGKQIAGGIRGTAQVVSTTGYFGRAVLQNARVNLVLNGEGITPTAVLYEGLIHNQKWPHPGQVLPAMIDQGNPQNYSILWEEVPNSKDAAQATAQGIAAAMAGDPSQLQNVLGTSTFSNVQVVGDVNSITPEQKAKLAAFGIDIDSLVAQSKASGTFQTGNVQAGTFAVGGEDTTSALERLAALHGAGSLTDAEFTEAKRKLLS